MIQTGVSRLALGPRKILNALVFIVERQGNKPFYKEWTMTLKKMCALNVSGTLCLRNIFKKLRSAYIFFKGEQLELFSMLELKKNDFEFKFDFNTKVKESILNGDCMALDVQAVSKFNHVYSMALFEVLGCVVLKNFSLGFARRSFRIDEFRKTMDLAEKLKSMQDFKRLFLVPSFAEINQQSRIKCGYSLHKGYGLAYETIKLTANQRKEMIRQEREDLAIKRMNERAKHEISELNEDDYEELRMGAIKFLMAMVSSWSEKDIMDSMVCAWIRMNDYKMEDFLD